MKLIHSLQEGTTQTLRAFADYAICRVQNNRIAVFDAQKNVIHLLNVDESSAGTHPPIWLSAIDVISDSPPGGASLTDDRFTCSIAADTSGNIAVYDGRFGQIQLMDANGQPIRPPLKLHVGCVKSIHFMPDGKILLFGKQAKSLIRQLDVDSLTVRHVGPTLSGLDYEDDCLAGVGPHCLVSYQEQVTFLRNRELEIIDVLGRNFTVATRFVGQRARFMGKEVDQWTHLLKDGRILVGAQFPPRGDSIRSLTDRNGGGIAILAYRNGNWFIECWSYEFELQNILQLPQVGVLQTMVCLSEDRFVLGTSRGDLHLANAEDLQPVSPHAYAATMRGIDEMFVEANLAQKQSVPPRIAESSLREVFRLAEAAGELAFVSIGLRVDSVGNVAAVEDLVLRDRNVSGELLFLAPSDSAGHSASEVCVIITRILQSLKFSPFIVNGKPESCKLFLSIRVAHIAEADINSGLIRSRQ